MKIIILITALYVTLFSQNITLTGTVRDMVTQAVIDSAKIELINKEKPAERYTLYTNNFGSWSYTFIPSSVENENLSPNSFTVNQNFPNPFNPATQISFFVPEAGEVNITVHNSVGQLIDRKTYSVDGGSYSLPWSSKGAAGVLFYTIYFGKSKITKKMIQLDRGTGEGLGSLSKYGGFSSISKAAVPVIDEYYLITSKFIYMPDTLLITPDATKQINTSLETVHNNSFVIDLHNDVMEKVIYGYQIGIRNSNNHSDIPRFKEGGVDAQMFALWTDPSDSIAHPYYSYTLAMVDSFNSQVAKNASKIAQARNFNEVMQVNSEGKLAGILAVEGGYAIENSLTKLINFYNLGMRYMTITWNSNTSWAVAAKDPKSTTVGLTEFGKQVIRLMDSLGIIIDVAHTGIKTINDILSVTKNPIIDSHCGVRALNNHYRNLYDYQIDSIAARGGVIGVCFYPPFLSSRSVANIDTVIKHIDYLKKRVGIDYIALGSDFDGIEQTPVGLEDVSKIPQLTAALLKKNYTISDVKKILGENFLRVFKRVCK